jgi:hypothetical protein
MIEEGQKLNELLKQSHANDSFKKAVLGFAEGHETSLIEYPSGTPRIKVIRVLMKLLEAFPQEPISHVSIEGCSSCSGYYGSLTFGPSNVKVKFDWDCRWKAEQEGLKTWYGEPNQTKAAQLFGYQCFKQFNRVI